MDSGSVVGVAWVNALSGMALAPALEVVALGVVPATEPPLMEDVPWTLDTPPMARAGAESTLEEGVYFVDEVRAPEPADADAADANDVTAPVPLAPEEALPWI